MTIRDEALSVLHVLAGQAPPPRVPFHTDLPEAPQWGQELAAAVADPAVERTRIDHLLAQLAEQVRLVGGQSGAAATAARLAVATVLAVEGPQAAGTLLAPWRAARTSAGPAAAGCPGCAAEVELRVLAELGLYTKAVAVLDSIPGGGPAELGCQQHDAALLAAALLPLLGAGHGHRAVAWHGQGLRRVMHDRVGLHLLADHLDFLRLTGNGSAAIELARAHAALLHAGCTPAHRLRWLTAAAQLAVEQVEAGHGGDLVTVAWPELPTEPMTLADFGVALQARAVPLAAAFDARNGVQRHAILLADRNRHDVVRTVLPVHQQAAAAQPRRRACRRPVTLPDVLACPDPYVEAEEAVLSCTLVDPVGVCEQLVLRAAERGDGREGAAHALLARVLCLAGDQDRCLAEAATAEAMSAAAGDRVGAAAARATAAACWIAVDPAPGLELVRLVTAELEELAPGIERDAALCRVRSAGVAALLALDRVEEAERWMAHVHPVHPGQQVRVASQRALVLRRRGQLAEAISVLRTAGRIADDYGLVALGVENRLDLAELLEIQRDIDGVVSMLTRALLDLPYVPEPDPFEIPHTRMHLARVLAEASRLDPARIELERARCELEAVPDAAADLATVDYLLGVVLRGLGQLTAALIPLKAAAAGFAQVHRLDGVALAEWDRGAVLFALDRDAEAAEAFDTAAEFSRAAGEEWHALACEIDAAKVRGYAGIAGAIDELRGLRATLSSGAAPGAAELAFQTARVDHALAHCALVGGDVRTAAELAELALASYRAAGADRAVAALSMDVGSWWWQAGDAGSALSYLRSAMRSARALGDGPLMARGNAALRRFAPGEFSAQSDHGRDGTTLPRP